MIGIGPANRLDPPVVELLGPPGSGKSTVRQALCADPAVAVAVSVYWRPRHTVPFVRSAISLLPMVLRQRRRHPFASRERDWILRLGAAGAIVRRVSERPIGAAVFDQGPVYTLVRLRGAIPERERTPELRRWWEGTVEAWATALDLLVVLDASADELTGRIRARPKAHLLQARPHREVRAALLRERRLYEEVVAELLLRRPITVLRFDTGPEPADRIAARIQAELKAARTPSATRSGSS